MGKRRAQVGRLNAGREPSAPVLVVLAAGLAKRYGGCKPLAPVGVHGEAVIDLTVSDALAGGWGEVVMVVGPSTASAITYHVERCWPPSVEVGFALQPVPLGTAHALLCARRLVGDRPFGVVNADDIYGAPSLEILSSFLKEDASARPRLHALVSYALENTVVSEKPVTRGTCTMGAERTLEAIVERRKVVRHDDGTFTSSDGLEPAELDPRVPVSVNLWGFKPSIWQVLETAVIEAHPSVSKDGSVPDPGALKDDTEVLLPEVVGEMVRGERAGEAQQLRVIEGIGRCIGVTHPEDLWIVRAELASMIARGVRPEATWAGLTTTR